jgi:hypothetical protein
MHIVDATTSIVIMADLWVWLMIFAFPVGVLILLGICVFKNERRFLTIEDAIRELDKRTK